MLPRELADTTPALPALPPLALTVVALTPLPLEPELTVVVLAPLPFEPALMLACPLAGLSLEDVNPPLLAPPEAADKSEPVDL